MRFYFRQRIPQFDRVLLIESGARDVAERLLPALRRNHGEHVSVDLVSCYAEVPAGYAPEEPGGTRVYRVSDYQGRAGFNRLVGELRDRPYPVVGVICSAEPIMTKWKWALGARLPAKIFVVNENGDYFWLDYSNWRITGYFVLFRAGLVGPGAAGAIARLAFFPFTLAYLLLYAAAVHIRRACRRLMHRVSA